MSYSKVSICNIALAHLGAASIRSFDEVNKRARMSEVFYDQARDYTLARFDWPFARKSRRLQQLVVPDEELIPNLFPYELPNDCRTPRELHPPGSKEYWHVMENRLWCYTDLATSGKEVLLYYTSQETNPAKFSDTFVALLALLLAIKMAHPLTQDKAIVSALNQQYSVEQVNAWESDANIGNIYREVDENPDYDTFVNPDGASEIDLYGRS